jgi:hypothetical protein
MTEKSAAESVEQVRKGMSDFLHSNAERAERMRHPREGCLAIKPEK